MPLGERLKFLEIFTSNLDEFYMVRVGSLLSLESMDEKKVDNKSLMTAREQLNAIFAETRRLYEQRDRVFSYLRRKLLQITYRDKESEGVKYITHIGNGNFNAKTAKLYTDLALITADDAIGRDGSMFFRNMGIGNLWGEYQTLLVAPVNFKKSLLEYINGEITKARKGEPAYILAKMNSFTDRQLIDAIYEAGQAGVKVDLIIRGITCFVPERPGLADNVKGRNVDADGEYYMPAVNPGDKLVDAQTEMMKQ